MTIESFNKNYKRLGGFNKFKKLLDEGYTLEHIANYFNVTRVTVNYWLQAFNLKKKRKTYGRVKTDYMINFGRKFGKKMFDEAYNHAGEWYFYRKALKEARELGVFDEEKNLANLS